ncbi:MAG: glycosyltransferase family 4 protein [Acidimicrobiia bacterium]|nr:glycosyltransferase family 4 protein [Acidimicrobiia bacterium]
MRVALVCPYDLGRFGGVQDQVGKLAGWLRDDGHQPVVVGPGVGNDPGVRLVGRSRVVPVNRSAAPVALAPRVWRMVAEAIADADVVHVHEPLVPAVSLAAMATASAPVVATLHADASTLMRRSIRVGRPAVRRVLSRAAVVTAVSPVAASVVSGITEVRLVPNGIDLAIWGKRPKRPGSVVFVGRDDARKGLDVLLGAWPAVRRRVPRASLDIVGVERLGVAVPGARSHGRVDDDTKRRLLASSEVMVAPNTVGESFGVILVEGMAAGCALVASALPGFVHVAGSAARWVAPGDVDALGWAVAGLLDDHAARRVLVAAGTERVARFDRAPVLAGYLAAYHDALGVNAVRRAPTARRRRLTG